MRRMISSLLFVSLWCLPAVAQDDWQATEWEALHQEKKALEQKQKELEKRQRFGDPFSFSSRTEEARRIQTRLKEIEEQWDDALYRQILLEQGPAETLKVSDSAGMFPPYLRAVRVTDANGDVYYDAYLKSPDLSGNTELIEKGLEVYVLHQYHKAMMKEIKRTEKNYIDVTNRYIRMLEDYNFNLQASAFIKGIITGLATYIKSKGSGISVFVDAGDKFLSTAQYAFFRDSLGNNFAVTFPNYPAELLRQQDSLKGDPLEWVKAEIQAAQDGRDPDFGDSPLQGHGSYSLGEYAEQLAWYWWGVAKKKKSTRETLKGAIKEGTKQLNEYLAMETAERAVAELKGKTSREYLTSGIRSIAVDAAAAGIIDLLDQSEDAFFEAATAEIEWYVLRRKYHFTYAKLRALEAVLDQRFREYQQLLKQAALETLPGRKWGGIPSKRLKASYSGERYTLHLKFNEEVKLEEFKMVGVPSHSLTNDFRSWRLSAYSPTTKTIDEEKIYHDEYTITFTYKRPQQPPPVGDKLEEIKISIKAFDRDGNELDSEPATIPQYTLNVEYNPYYDPVKNPKVYEKIRHRWELYEPGNDTKHRLKAIDPMAVRVTLEGAAEKTLKIY